MRGEYRKPTYLFIDECQNFLSPSFRTILEQSRKFGLFLTMTSQAIEGLGRIQDTVMTNTSIKLIGRTDSLTTMRKMHSITGAGLHTFQQLNNHQFYIKTADRKGRVYTVPDVLIKDRSQIISSEQEQQVNYQQVKRYYSSIETDPPKAYRKSRLMKHHL